MSSDIVIQVENLSKQYRLGEVSTGSLHHDINRWWHRVRGLPDPYLSVTGTNIRTGKVEKTADRRPKTVGRGETGTTEGAENTEGQGEAGGSKSLQSTVCSLKSDSDYVWALRDINFEVKRGEVLGIIGRNGAGKSTLLKIMSRITAPTTGEVRVKGRIASLLEVGTGFHQDLTGRENIYLNGAVLGMTRAEIASKLDEIVEFSGCAAYLDTPVKRYSSGMVVRLGFAVAAHLEPEILIVDEVLAVGDAEFQKKCIGKMQDVASHGRTVLFVSHNMAAIQRLCPQSLLLSNGELACGPVPSGEAVHTYLRENKAYCSGPVAFHRDGFTLDAFQIVSADGEKVDGPLWHDESYYVEITFSVDHAELGFNVGYVLYNEVGDIVYVTVTTDTDPQEWPPISKGRNCLRSKIPSYFLNEGEYQLGLIASVHSTKWLAHPDKDNIRIALSVRMGTGKSPYWRGKRTGLLAPLPGWESVQKGE